MVGGATDDATGGFEGAVEAKATQAAGEAHQIDALTRRMQLLMDSYQQRIDDLMGEVQDLRKEIVSLRKALDERPRFSEGIGIECSTAQQGRERPQEQPREGVELRKFSGLKNTVSATRLGPTS